MNKLLLLLLTACSVCGVTMINPNVITMINPATTTQVTNGPGYVAFYNFENDHPYGGEITNFTVYGGGSGYFGVCYRTNKWRGRFSRGRDKYEHNQCS